MTKFRPKVGPAMNQGKPGLVFYLFCELNEGPVGIVEGQDLERRHLDEEARHVQLVEPKEGAGRA